MLGVLGVAVYLAFGGPLPFSHAYTVDAVVQSANELHGGSPVRIAGVNVGKVTKVERGPGHTAIVEMAIEKPGARSTATHAEDPAAPVPRGQLLRRSEGRARRRRRSSVTGGTIPLAQTATPVQLDQLLSTLDHDTRDSLRTLFEQAGGSLARGGAEAIDASFAPAVPAYKGVAVLAQSARGTQRG